MRLLALGDSYTSGEGVMVEESWPFLLAAAHPGLEPMVVARTGWTSGELLAALRADPPGRGFDAATVMVGVNDQYRGLAIESFADNAAALVALGRALTHSGAVVAVSIPDWSITPHGDEFDRMLVASQIDAFNSAWRGVADRHAVPFVDVTTISRRHPGMVASDGLHPSPTQHALWAGAIGPALGLGPPCPSECLEKGVSGHQNRPPDSPQNGTATGR